MHFGRYRRGYHAAIAAVRRPRRGVLRFVGMKRFF